MDCSCDIFFQIQRNSSHQHWCGKILSNSKEDRNLFFLCNRFFFVVFVSSLLMPISCKELIVIHLSNGWITKINKSNEITTNRNNDFVFVHKIEMKKQQKVPCIRLPGSIVCVVTIVSMFILSEQWACGTFIYSMRWIIVCFAKNDVLLFDNTPTRTHRNGNRRTRNRMENNKSNRKLINDAKWCGLQRVAYEPFITQWMLKYVE